jgi:hypothetical protein
LLATSAVAFLRCHLLLNVAPARADTQSKLEDEKCLDTKIEEVETDLKTLAGDRQTVGEEIHDQENAVNDYNSTINELLQGDNLIKGGGFPALEAASQGLLDAHAKLKEAKAKRDGLDDKLVKQAGRLQKLKLKKLFRDIKCLPSSRRSGHQFRPHTRRGREGGGREQDRGGGEDGRA